MLVDIYTTATTSDQLGENDRTRAGELIESVLLNLRGAVDEVSFWMKIIRKLFLIDFSLIFPVP